MNLDAPESRSGLYSAVPKSAADSNPLQSTAFQQSRSLAAASVVLGICFCFPLWNLIRFALHSELFSYVLIIPFISLYLLWAKKVSIPAASPPARILALVPFTAGLLVLGTHVFASRSGGVTSLQDNLTWTTLSFVLFFFASCLFCLGRDALRMLGFPLGFMIFIVPFPGFLVNGIESFLQHASALCAHALFSLTGMSFLRDGLIFQLPGIRIEVAPECSGIHSTLVLLITSLVAGQLFLRTPWKCAVLTLAVVPLGILRNAVRIVTIGQLCVQVSPEMINSPIHRHGGPLFFVVSLIPFFLLLYYLRRSEFEATSQKDPKQPT
jgi:exosortase C (VPDSG-CTERM-specific)